MYIILRPDMIIEADYPAVYIYSVIDKTNNLKINLKTNQAYHAIIDQLKNGYLIGGEARTADKDDKVIPYLCKNYSAFFDCVAEANRRKLVNQRSVLTYAHTTVEDKQVLRDYINGFDKIKIYLQPNKALWKDLQDHGFSGLVALDEKEGVDQGIILLDVDQPIPDNKLNHSDVIVLYSLTNLTIGPILIHGVTGCLTCFYEAY